MCKLKLRFRLVRETEYVDNMGHAWKRYSYDRDPDVPRFCDKCGKVVKSGWAWGNHVCCGDCTTVAH